MKLWHHILLIFISWKDLAFNVLLPWEICCAPPVNSSCCLLFLSNVMLLKEVSIFTNTRILIDLDKYLMGCKCSPYFLTQCYTFVPPLYKELQLWLPHLLTKYCYLHAKRSLIFWHPQYWLIFKWFAYRGIEILVSFPNHHGHLLIEHV